MKHLILLLAGLAMFAPAVAAEVKLTGTQACMQRCKDLDAQHEGPGVLPYDQKLAQIREQKKLETMLEKRKALELEEARARDMRQHFIGRSCRYICTGD